MKTWRNAETGEDIRTFCVITCPPNEMMATIHDRMPLILHREDYERWLSPEPDPIRRDEAVSRRADNDVADRPESWLAEERHCRHPRSD
jgi:putative SOS response-associated peptidase YedK